MNKSIRLVIVGLVALFVSLLNTACVSQNAAAKFAEFEKLGITEASITGKFSHTDYVVTVKDGVRRAELNHSNAWVPQVHIVRSTPVEPK